MPSWKWGISDGNKVPQWSCRDRPVSNLTEYEKSQEGLRSLEERLARLKQTHRIGSKGSTKAGVRKMIARLHEELAIYEGSEEVPQPASDRT
jgi:hypothetical protein